MPGRTGTAKLPPRLPWMRPRAELVAALARPDTHSSVSRPAGSISCEGQVDPVEHWTFSYRGCAPGLCRGVSTLVGRGERPCGPRTPPLSWLRGDLVAPGDEFHGSRGQHLRRRQIAFDLRRIDSRGPVASSSWIGVIDVAATTNDVYRDAKVFPRAIEPSPGGIQPSPIGSTTSILGGRTLDLGVGQG